MAITKTPFVILILAKKLGSKNIIYVIEIQRFGRILLIIVSKFNVIDF